ncbi:MAG: DNA-directed RNA polymerase subunit beta [Armatimonadetes bacterium]|nr:DNA-directed RNA polymerase subunit beta [Armatimonadota bacterium]
MQVQHRLKRSDPVVDLPNLVEIQLDSYQWFLKDGLRELFRSFSPIYDFTGNLSLELTDYTLGEPKYSVEECRDRDATYEAPIKANVRLAAKDREVIESEVYLGDLPLMTERGTFVINGAERVVVSQLARSPGVYFKDTMDLSGRVLYYATIIPNEGAWIEVESDAANVVTVRIGQTRKFPVTTLLRALNHFDQACPMVDVDVTVDEAAGLELIADVIDTDTGEVLVESGKQLKPRDISKIKKAVGAGGKVRVRRAAVPCDTTQAILDIFATREVIKEIERTALRGRRPVADIADPKSGKPIVKAYQKISDDAAKKIEALELKELELLVVNRYIEATLEADGTEGRDEALIDIYHKIRPGDPATQDSARNLLNSIFFDTRRYDLGRVGRYKVNRKLGLEIPEAIRTVTTGDLLGILHYIIRLSETSDESIASTDDIDHLENKRVRSIGELLQSQLRVGFLRMEKVAKERMTSMDTENVIPQVVLSVKPISASIKSFFGSSQLSQFMDQTNPLAELAHKRRLSALGPGGLSRQSAKLEVRDVHHSHFARICPIETPEGPNIGLIGSMACHAQIDAYGFLRTSYRKVADGVVSMDLAWLSADEEERVQVTHLGDKPHIPRIAPANTPLDENGRIVAEELTVREGSQYPSVPRATVDYMDIAPQQMVSVATALIPFLENDDASRALMGSNMQRQAVPLLRSDAPCVKTGLEARSARDSGAMILAKEDGVVKFSSADRITVERRDGTVDEYRPVNLLRSNQATCITQKPVVVTGQRVRKGDVLADGPCTDNGELGLGKNVLVAFVPWHGYNYEDAILLSQRLVKDDVYTSIHIEKYETEARDTKLGPEEITRDIPNVGEDMLKDLDENGIVRIGAEVRAEDIIVGKVAPKGQGELSAEERLIIAIFGKKAEETRDVSLRVPHGEKGKIVDVKVFSRFKYRCEHCDGVFNYSKKPDRTTCERCEGELIREQPDELSAGVNMLVRVYIAQKRKVMEGDKMAGRHGNKGVISKILPEADMPFLPDGTPVDIVLNPLGVPSRMNIGQVLETHLGLVSRYLDVDFVTPIFQGATEAEILADFSILVWRLKLNILQEMLTRDLGLEIDTLSERELKRLTDRALKDLANRSEPPFDTSAEPIAEKYRGILEQAKARLSELDPVALETLARKLNQAAAVDQPEAVWDWEHFQPDGEPDESADGSEEETPKPPVVKAVGRYKIEPLISEIERRVEQRCGINDQTGKAWLRDGLTGEKFLNPVTVGHIYMLKLLHLVDDKIHARSTGPYSLVTQQPLGGKAQFGGQRFGEMEVWALEAYGAAYTLQEILTIKSDDVVGRVKTYEAIVKGETIMEPGVPESFKILVNELQSLCLKVSVADDRDRDIDLRDSEDEYPDTDDPVRAAARRSRQIVRMAPEETRI